MLCLGLDTALGACSVALVDDRGIRARRFQLMSIGHAETIAPMTDWVLKDAGITASDIDRIAVTVGPGTFTGQRIGLAFARGLALALKIPCVGLTTLEAIAAGARAEHPGRPAMVAIDARRGEVYLQAFAADGTPFGEPAMLALDAATTVMQVLGPDLVAAGTGARLVAEKAGLAPIIAEADQPDAAHVARLGLTHTPGAHPPAPLYLRAPDAKLPGPLRPLPPRRGPAA